MQKLISKQCTQCSKIIEASDSFCPYCSAGQRKAGRSDVGALLTFGLPFVTILLFIFLIGAMVVPGLASIPLLIFLFVVSLFLTFVYFSS